MTFEFKPGCTFCDKRGLPILVVRYATAPETAGAPHVDLVDVDHETPLPQPGGGLHYTRRLLRGGYLYVYDEKRNQWDGYFVTDDAYLLHFQVDRPIPLAYTPDLQPCNQSGHPEVAGMVTIIDPKNAGTVWFAFSDVEWTPAVLAAHANPAYRARHMQKVDLQKALGKVKQDDVHPIHELGGKVAEFACDPLKATASKAFYDSPFPFHPRRLQLEQTLRAADSLRQDAGIIVGVFDPVGVAIELSARMHGLLSNYLDLKKQNEENTRKIVVSTNILQLRANVQARAEEDRVARTHTDHGVNAAAAGLGMLVDPSLRQAVENTGKASAADLDQARADAWKRYTHQQNGAPRFDEAAVEEFHRSHTEHLHQYTQSVIHPLARLHVAWLNSGRMRHYMAAVFDTRDIRSGAAYLQVVRKLIDGTQGIEPCFRQYEAWLDSDSFDPDNFLLRALLHNNDTLIAPAAAATGVDARIMPWDALLGTYKGAMEKLSGKEADQAALLLATVAGPAAKVGNRIAGGANKALVVIFGMLSGRPLVRYAFDTTRDRIRAGMTRLLLGMQRATLTREQVQLAIDRDLELARIRNEKLNGRQTVRWVALLEPQGTRPPASLEAVRVESMQKVLNGEVRIGVCTGLLQYWCVTKIFADYGAALEGDRTEAAWRCAAGALGVTGNAMETFGTLLENAAEERLPWARGIATIRWANRFSMTGKALGFGGALIMGVWDWIKGWQELQKGNIENAALFGASGALGIAAGIMLTWFAFNPFMPIVVFLFMATAYMLETTKDNAMQTWLENCIFGIHKDRYRDAEQEMRDYQRALG